ncbi:polysaccharide pyruvyl transferase family protein [Capilliphycus salinus ALCB114379]|uniref:polysaccharide pyruvyl transferase family protein n=1 Tax=Capilliphycus salinus TaxID=2768948 RepID=UPI0039A4E37B
MKLFYYQRRDGFSNFGDQLNNWLWPQLLPGFFDEDETTAFIGIGTLLNQVLPQRVPQAKRLIIFSTGAGYEQPLKTIDKSWKIYCVRGKLSAKKLGLSPDLAITDGAILTRRLYQPLPEKRYHFTYMPHIHHATFAGEIWKNICENIGFCYLDPRSSVEEVLSTINQTEVLLAEAMHGAIIADIFRVPWIPIITSPRILPFKWKDWCSSIGVQYYPYSLSPFVESYPKYARGINSSVKAFNHWKNSLWQFPNFTQFWQEQQQLYQIQLLKIAETGRQQLSLDSQLERLTVQLEEKLDLLKTDWGSNS